MQDCSIIIRTGLTTMGCETQIRATHLLIIKRRVDSDPGQQDAGSCLGGVWGWGVHGGAWQTDCPPTQ